MTWTLRQQWTEDLRAEYGDEWVEKHNGLATEWDYLCSCHFLD